MSLYDHGLNADVLDFAEHLGRTLADDPFVQNDEVIGALVEEFPARADAIRRHRRTVLDAFDDAWKRVS